MASPVAPAITPPIVPETVPAIQPVRYAPARMNTNFATAPPIAPPITKVQHLFAGLVEQLFGQPAGCAEADQIRNVFGACPPASLLADSAWNSPHGRRAGRDNGRNQTTSTVVHLPLSDGLPGQ